MKKRMRKRPVLLGGTETPGAPQVVLDIIKITLF